MRQEIARQLKVHARSGKESNVTLPLHLTPVLVPPFDCGASTAVDQLPKQKLPKQMHPEARTLCMIEFAKHLRYSDILTFLSPSSARTAMSRTSTRPLTFPLCRSMRTRPPLLLLLLMLLIPRRLPSFFALTLVLLA